MRQSGRLAMDHRFVRPHAVRWIGFSEDDVCQSPKAQDIRQGNPAVLANALRTTRSTLADATWGGSASPKTMGSRSPKAQGRLTPHIFANALRTTRSTSEKIVRILLAAGGVNQIQGRECAAGQVRKIMKTNPQNFGNVEQKETKLTKVSLFRPSITRVNSLPRRRSPAKADDSRALSAVGRLCPPRMLSGFSKTPCNRTRFAFFAVCFSILCAT